MNIQNLHTITGQETPPEPSQPVFALIQFYRAFNQQNFELMQENWLQTEEASMANPLGGLKRGWNEIKQVYEKIFYGPASVYVEYYDFTIHQSDNMFIAAGKERGRLTISDNQIDLAIRTSRVYVFKDKRWQHLHHHGSMDNPGLLDRYQSLILSQHQMTNNKTY